jgi:LuxR family maltose regulon positive regulatory protein
MMAMPAAKIQERSVRNTDPPEFMFQPVRTPVLDDLLGRDGIRHKLVSVVAPVGYGKTVLMASLCAQLQDCGEQCFWAALDERDTSLERLLGLLEEMAYGPSIGLHPTQALLRGDLPVYGRIEALIKAAVDFGAPFTVFIDNLNYCADTAVGEFLEALVFKTPPTVRFVFSSMAELPFSLARAKLAGLVRQVGYRELSLDAGEVGEMLGADLSAAIGSAGVETVQRQTEGWPAAVRMAQIILSATDRPLEALERFSGSDEDIAALLNQQVLSGFPYEIRQFLLSIAHLRTFSSELCRHATGNAEAEQYLGLLLRRNVFIIPLDRNRTWYRLHGLFREFLLGESRFSLDPYRQQAVLQRAAAWCEQGGYWRDAIDYAIAAGDITTAAKILEHTAQTFVGDRGDLMQYIDWVEALHTRGLQLDWEAEYWYTWALVLNRRYEQGRQQNERLAEWVRLGRDTEDPARIEDFQRRVDIISACVGIFTDHLEEAFRNASHWLACGGSDDPFNATAADCTKGIYHISAYQLRDARLALQGAQGAAFQIKGAYTDGWIAALNGLITLLEGDSASVYQELMTAQAAARQALGENAGIGGTIALIAAAAAVDMGFDQEAERLLVPALRLSKFHGFVDAAACGLDAAIKLWNGQDRDAISLRELRDFAACYPPRLSFMLNCYLVQRLIRLGRLDEAEMEAARLGLRADEPERSGGLPEWADVARCRDLFAATEIELCIALGRHKRAEQLIAQEIRLAKADGRAARLVELALSEAVIAGQAHNVAAANRHLTRAVTLAARRGIVRPFRDRAGAIADLVEDTKPSAWGFALEVERKFFASICRELPISNPQLQEKLVALNMDSQLLETLTARQMELLGLLAAGLTNQQLADRINVTVTTIKGHLQKLYAKLGVSSRSAALARARVLNLLP